MIEGRFVDLSHTLLPGKEEYKLELETYDTSELYPQYEKDRETWYILQEMHMFSHCGTHIEFPYHHNKNGMDASTFPLERLITDAVRWLIEEKRINLIGTDASGIEVKGVKNQPNHQLLMDHEIPIIEFAANLGDLRQNRFVIFVLALSVIGLDSCPVRLLALERKGKST